MSFQPLFKKHQQQSDYHEIDLSKNTLEKHQIDVSNHNALSQYLNSIKFKTNTQILYGGYLEKRRLYDKVDRFIANEKQRNIHLGYDFWADAGEEITTAFTGHVHSFANNDDKGNYGPTIILEHNFENQHFYSLYGHLSLDSIQYLKVGQTFQKGDIIAKIGEASVNGGYVPHLHFQLIKNIGNYKGDYPGVCHSDDLDFFKNNTINPNILLGI